MAPDSLHTSSEKYLLRASFRSWLLAGTQEKTTLPILRPYFFTNIFATHLATSAWL